MDSNSVSTISNLWVVYDRRLRRSSLWSWNELNRWQGEFRERDWRRHKSHEWCVFIAVRVCQFEASREKEGRKVRQGSGVKNKVSMCLCGEERKG